LYTLADKAIIQINSQNNSAALRRNRRNGEDFAGFFVQDDGHIFVAGGRCKSGGRKPTLVSSRALVARKAFSFSAEVACVFCHSAMGLLA
jgi:hypothetical protein